MEKIKNTLEYLQTISDNELVIDSNKLAALTNKSNTKVQPMIIKILIIIGAVFTCVFSIAFLMLIGLVDYPIAMIVLGLILICTAITLTYKPQDIFLDTLFLSLYCAGYGLLGFGLASQTESSTIISLTFCTLSTCTLLYSKNYIIIFTSTIILLSSIKILLLEISPVLDGVYFCLIALSTVYLLFNEAKLIAFKQQIAQLYDATKTASIIYLVLQFTPLSNLYYYSSNFNNYEILIMEYMPWIKSIFLILLVLYISSKILEILELHSTIKKKLIYLFIIIVLIPTAIQPSITTSIVILLSCYYVNYKTGVGIGILSFLYFISRFYYDMNITLLNKSIALMISGVLFLVVYYCLNKFLSPHGKD